MGYVVLTSVDRDDIPDGGAEHFARTARPCLWRFAQVMQAQRGSRCRLGAKQAACFALGLPCESLRWIEECWSEHGSKSLLHGGCQGCQ